MSLDERKLHTSVFGPPQNSDNAMDNVHFDQITSADLRANPLHSDNTWELIPWFDEKNMYTFMHNG